MANAESGCSMLFRHILPLRHIRALAEPLWGCAARKRIRVHGGTGLPAPVPCQAASFTLDPSRGTGDYALMRAG